jgi:hypothetical protein
MDFSTRTDRFFQFVSEQSGRSQRGFWIGFGLIALLQVLVLPFNPLPWFDEVYFADVSLSLVETGQMKLRMLPSAVKGEVLFYGPVYFYLQALITKAIGLDIFQFRLLNFVSGMGLVLLFRQFLRAFGFRPFEFQVLPLLLFVTPVFWQNMHSGRMDLLATLAGFGGLYFLLQSWKSKQLSPAFWAGLLVSVSFLTTPRMIFMLVPLGLLSLLLLPSWQWKSFFLFALAALAPVLAWFFWKFDSLDAYLAMFQGGAVGRHIGIYGEDSVFFRYPALYPVYGLVILACRDLWRKDLLKNLEGRLRLFAFLVIVLFHLVVVERGPYSAMVLVFYLLFIALGLRETDLFAWRKWTGLASLLCLVGYLGMQSAKVGLILSQLDDRRPDRFVQQFQSPNLRDQRVVASFEYYYELKKQGVRFCPYQIPVDARDKVKYQLDTFQCAYMLVSRQDLNSHTILEYLNTGQFAEAKQWRSEKKIHAPALVPGPAEEGGFQYSLNSYQGILFRRKPLGVGQP